MNNDLKYMSDYSRNLNKTKILTNDTNNNIVLIATKYGYYMLDEDFKQLLRLRREYLQKKKKKKI